MLDVYIVVHSWSNDDEDGFDVENVYTELNAAQSAMRALSERIKSDFCMPFDEDLSYEDDTEIHFGHDSRSFCSVPTTHCIQIIQREVMLNQ